MEKMDKGELRTWAEMFATQLCRGIGTPAMTELKFAHNGVTMTPDEFMARLTASDPELAKRFKAWFDASMSLGSYVSDRLEGSH